MARRKRRSFSIQGPGTTTDELSKFLKLKPEEIVRLDEIIVPIPSLYDPSEFIIRGYKPQTSKMTSRSLFDFISN
jgi:hypothetical protein